MPMLTTISPTAVAAHLERVQSGLQMLYHSGRLVRANPAMFPPPAVAELRGMLERGAFETWQCETLLSAVGAANDEPAKPVQA